MFVSTETGSFEKYGDNFEIVSMLKNAGFDAFDYTMYSGAPGKNIFVDDKDYLKKAEALRKFADSIGIVCNQTHAPFPSVRIGNDQYNKEIIVRINRAIEITAVLGGKVCVIHPFNDYTPEQNAELYAKFLPTAERCGVIIGAENMWNWDNKVWKASPAACCEPVNFLQTLKAVNSPYLKACVDIGHAEMDGLGTTAEDMILALGDNIVALHIHDNDRWHDSHSLPFLMKIDFQKVLAALRKIGYKGDITFEADTAPKGTPKELIPDLARFMAAIGKYMRNEVLSVK